MNATKEDMSMIEKNQAWELVDCPKHHEIIGVKWIYKLTLNQNISIQRHKHDWWRKVFSKSSIDFSKNFANVARLETIRTLISLSAQKSWSIYQFDVKSTFLNGVLKDEVYVQQPKRFITEGGENKFHKLKKVFMSLSKHLRHDMQKLIITLQRKVSKNVQANLLFVF